jgi:hypothetical protein
MTFATSEVSLLLLLMAWMDPIHARRHEDVIKCTTDTSIKPAEEGRAIQTVEEAREYLGLQDVSAELEQAKARRADLKRRLRDEGSVPRLVEAYEDAVAEEAELTSYHQAWSGELAAKDGPPGEDSQPQP